MDTTKSAYGPRLYGVGENNFGLNPPASERFAVNRQANAILYRDAAGSFRTPPMDFFYENNGGSENPCLTWGWGVRRNAQNDIDVGSGLGCPSGTAW